VLEPLLGPHDLGLQIKRAPLCGVVGLEQMLKVLNGRRGEGDKSAFAYLGHVRHFARALVQIKDLGSLLQRHGVSYHTARCCPRPRCSGGLLRALLAGV